MFVVVGLVDRVAMLPMEVVVVVEMGHSWVATVRLMHVHVGAVRDVMLAHGLFTAG